MSMTVAASAAAAPAQSGDKANSSPTAHTATACSAVFQQNLPPNAICLVSKALVFDDKRAIKVETVKVLSPHSSSTFQTQALNFKPPEST